MMWWKTCNFAPNLSPPSPRWRITCATAHKPRPINSRVLHNKPSPWNRIAATRSGGNLEYRQLGNSDLRVSAMVLGARNQAFTTEYVAGIETVKSLQMEPQLNARY